MVEFFTFPSPAYVSQKRSYPLEIENERLSFAFVEVGCKHRGKRSQLKNKKELFLKYWSDKFRYTGAVDWVPQVFRLLSHYNEVDYLPRENNKYSVDAIIRHDYIPVSVLESLTVDDKNSIRSKIRDRKNQDIIEELIETKNAQGIHDLILTPQENNKSNILRGKIAEILTQKAIESIVDNEIVRYKNGYLKYFNKKYDTGAEIDDVLQFYDPKTFEVLLERLDKIDYLTLSLDSPSRFV